MSRPPADDDAFIPEEIEALCDLGIFLAPETHGKRSVPITAFAPPQPQRSRASPAPSSPPSATFRRRGFASSRGATMLDLPTSARSAAALEFVGFTPAVAQQIFDHWSDRPDPEINCYGIISYAEGYVQSKDSWETSPLPAREFMTRMGLNAEMQDALADPRFAAVAGTESLQFWIKETLRANWTALSRLQGRLREVVQAAIRRRSRTAAAASATNDEDVDDGNMSVSLASIAEADAGPILPDHYVLYKAVVGFEMESLMRLEGEDEVDLAQFWTYSRGDFNHMTQVWSWTPEAETAEVYRRWMERRCPGAEMCIIRIQLPKAVVDGMKTEELWSHGSEWKEYVWHCRGKNHPPRRLGKYRRYGQTGLIKGHVSTGVATRVKRDKEFRAEDMNEDNVLRLESGAKCQQWVFMQYTCNDLIEEGAQDKIHVDITAASRMQEKRGQKGWGAELWSWARLLMPI